MTTLESVIHDKLKRYNINVLNPVTIQDKLNWLMLHDSTPLKGVCADKIRVREYVTRVLGEDICVPVVKVYNRPEDIKLSELPDKFVIKANHGFNMNIICKDKSKFNLQERLPEIRKWMNTNFGVVSGQAHYSYITPRIVVEELLEDEKQQDSLFDYKFWCFNGEPKLWTINDGHGHGDIMYYDMDGNTVDLYGLGTGDKYERPAGFEKMVEYAKKLSEEFIFVRVDFYEVAGRIYLGELTFTPGNGKFRYKDHATDVMVGKMLKLPEKKTYDDGVSICLTAFKAQNYVEETLNSIYKQTWFKTHNNWEVLIGIDGCMDTLKKVREIMPRYKNLRVLMMDSNCGTYVTTNTVMSQAKYKWLIRFDSDDIMLPELVETLFKYKGISDYVTFHLMNFGNVSGSRQIVTKTCGQLLMNHTVFDDLGGFLPWTCSADAEMEKRVEPFYVKKKLSNVLMKRRIHGGNLTVKRNTNMSSPLRRYNINYINYVTKENKSRQRAVAVRITNFFTEIKDPGTPFKFSGHTFPRLDVVYQTDISGSSLKKAPRFGYRTPVRRIYQEGFFSQNYLYNSEEQ